MKWCNNRPTTIVPIKHSIFIVISSSFFLFPAYYAFVNNLYVYSIILTKTSLISISYWIYPCYGYRRNLDLFYAKFAFSIFVYLGIVYNLNIQSILLLLLLLVCYYKSCNLVKYWYIYHVLFHLCLMIEQSVILQSIIHTNKIQS